MKHVMIVTHAKLAEGFKEAIKMIAGEESAVVVDTIGMLEGMDPQDFIEQVNVCIQKDPDGDYLILADMFGASPCNTSLMAFQHKNYRMVTGLNLGMALEAVMNVGSMSLEDLAEHLVVCGKGGIQSVYLPPVD